MPHLTPRSLSSRPLLQRAKKVREQTLRACTRSVQLVEHAVMTLQRVLASRDSRALARVGLSAPGWLQDIVEMPLKPWMLLELAEEFHQLAKQSALPEVGAALHALGFRYRALAAGFDSTVVASRRLH